MFWHPINLYVILLLDAYYKSKNRFFFMAICRMKNAVVHSIRANIIIHAGTYLLKSIGSVCIHNLFLYLFFNMIEV